jgi:hypothetical protein
MASVAARWTNRSRSVAWSRDKEKTATPRFASACPKTKFRSGVYRSTSVIPSSRCQSDSVCLASTSSRTAERCWSRDALYASRGSGMGSTISTSAPKVVSRVGTSACSSQASTAPRLASPIRGPAILHRWSDRSKPPPCISGRRAVLPETSRHLAAVPFDHQTLQRRYSWARFLAVDSSEVDASGTSAPGKPSAEAVRSASARRSSRF